MSLDMNRVMEAVLIAITVLMLTACATNPDRIGKAYVSTSEYYGYSCQQLSNAYSRNERDAAALYSSMKSKSRVNATAGVVGALVFWPALFFMKGKDADADMRLAELKGRKAAIESAMNRNGC